MGLGITCRQNIKGYTCTPVIREEEKNSDLQINLGGCTSLGLSCRKVVIQLSISVLHTLVPCE